MMNNFLILIFFKKRIIEKKIFIFEIKQARKINTMQFYFVKEFLFLFLFLFDDKKSKFLKLERILFLSKSEQESYTARIKFRYKKKSHSSKRNITITNIRNNSHFFFLSSQPQKFENDKNK